MATSPFFISILSYFILLEQLKKIEFAGMIVSFVGVLILIFSRGEAAEAFKSYDGFYIIGLGCAMIQSTS